MEELSEYTSQVIEFKPAQKLQKQIKVTETCVGTDALPAGKDEYVETSPKSHSGTQTQASTTPECAAVDERKLANWLRKIYPAVEAQLKKGPTPLLDNYNVRNAATYAEESKIQTYQKISMDALENSQGIATWLSVYTNNAPILVTSTIAPHDDWCEHTQQTLKLFVPRRMQAGNFVIFNELKQVPLKACLTCLTTNSHNKSMFAGSTMDGDIHVWLYKPGTGDGGHDVVEMFCVTSEQGCAVALDWASETRLLTFHASGWVICWIVGKELLKESDYKIQPPNNGSNEVTAAVCLSTNSFVIGTKDGGVYHYTLGGVNALKKQMDILTLKQHLFMVSTLLKTTTSGRRMVLSCDLSGQVFYHDIQNADEDNTNVIIQIPLPFKNAIACSSDAGVIYCPGNDGSLECYRLSHGVHTIIKGALRGKGNFIKCSDNGYWIISGLYMGDFQIFYLEE